MLDVGALYATHWEPICRFLRRTAPDLSAGDIEDVAALAFEKAARAAADNAYREQGTAGSWLFQVARNALKDYWRDQSRQPREVEITTDAPGGRVTTDAGSQLHVTRLEVAAALTTLTDRERIVLIEEYWIGASLEETAVLMEATVDAVKQLRMRARARLYRLLTAAA